MTEGDVANPRLLLETAEALVKEWDEKRTGDAFWRLFENLRIAVRGEQAKRAGDQLVAVRRRDLARLLERTYDLAVERRLETKLRVEGMLGSGDGPKVETAKGPADDDRRKLLRPGAEKEVELGFREVRDALSKNGDVTKAFEAFEA